MNHKSAETQRYMEDETDKANNDHKPDNGDKPYRDIATTS